MRAVKQVMLFIGMDPTIMSVFSDLIELEKKMIHRRKKKQKLSVAEVFFRKETLDNYLKRQLWHLGLVVLKHRKAAKAWHIRFELIKKLSAVERFVLNNKTYKIKESSVIQLEDEGGAKGSKNAVVEDHCVFEDETDMPSDKEEMRLVFVYEIIRQELAFCQRVNKYHPRNYYQWTYRL